MKQTSQLIRHPTLSSSVQELWLQLDSETLGRSSSTHPVSYTNKKCLENKDGHTKKPSTFNHIHKMEIKIQIIKDTYTQLREYTCDAAVPARDGANPPYNLSHPSCLTTFNTNQSNSRTCHKNVTQEKIPLYVCSKLAKLLIQFMILRLRV